MSKNIGICWLFCPGGFIPSSEGREKHLGPEHLDTLNSLLNLGDLLTHTRQFEEAKGNLWEPYGDKEGILQ